MKICKTCKFEKEYSEFYINKRMSDGYRSDCKDCVKKLGKEWKKVARTNLEYRQKERDNYKIHYQKTLEYQSERRKRYYYKNLDLIKAKKTLNKDERNLKLRIWQKERYKNNEFYNMEHRFRTRLQKMLRKYLVDKKNKSINYLGCTKEEFKIHLENQFIDGMNWENRNLWHIDHIKPCCSFDLTNEEELYECFNYKNLRPLWAKDNSIKSKNDILCKKQKLLKLNQ